MAGRRTAAVPLRATLLAALAACAALGVPALRAAHAGSHAAHPTLVAARSATLEAAADHEDASCSLCQTFAAADQPLMPFAMAALPLPAAAADALAPTRCTVSAPRRAPVHADARAPPRG